MADLHFVYGDFEYLLCSPKSKSQNNRGNKSTLPKGPDYPPVASPLGFDRLSSNPPRQQSEWLESRQLASLDAADYKLNFFGYLALAPAEHYGGHLPKTFFSSRRALETLLRRLILDPAKYPNIKQVIGTVTGLLVDSAHPEKSISAAVVRDRDGVSQQISSSLLIGQISVFFSSHNLIDR